MVQDQSRRNEGARYGVNCDVLHVAATIAIADQDTYLCLA